MFIKSTVFLALVACANAAIYQTFYEHSNLQGKRVFCEVDIDICYNVPDHVGALGLSSFQFGHNDWSKKSWTVVLFSGDGANCAGNYDSFGFTQAILDGKTSVSAFPTVNDRVRSFKIYNHKGNNVAGGWQVQAEDDRTPSCKIYN
ncbi:MAG: hypothetical protein J3R72DRAFT_474917 [Linnemannia gamsii]|nr:MAG: hypothetical protein J3R72DRAFT_474917 [Linnemannia gamsii]